MEVGKHPTINELSTQSDQEWVKQHVASCQRCAAMLEGLQLIQEEADKRHEPVDSLLRKSREENWQQIRARVPTRNFNINRWVGAAVLVFGLCLSLWFIYPANEVDVTGQIHTPYPAPSTFRSTEVDEKIPFTVYYDLGEYEEAREVLNSMEPNGEVLFYMGQTYLYQKHPRFDSAHYYFSSDQVSQSLYKEVAGFYDAVAYLKNQDTVSARDKLMRILETPNHSRKETSLLLLELIGE